MVHYKRPLVKEACSNAKKETYGKRGMLECTKETYGERGVFDCDQLASLVHVDCRQA
jgi:hypothetical protein